MQIIIGSYFEIESLRRDFNNAIITTDTNQIQNHYNIVTGIYTLVHGKTTNSKNIRQYPISAKLLDLIIRSGIQHGVSLCSDLNLFYKYMNEFVGDRKGQSSAINYLRICKAKWIECLNISDSKKLEMHEKMAHSYETTLNWYV